MAVIEYWWFQAMQDEIHEFDQLEVWELVPRLIYVMVISLKWIYKVKLDEYGDVLKNKSRLVAKDNPTHVNPEEWPLYGLKPRHQGRGTINMGLWYPKDNAMSLTAYADADHAGGQDSRRSNNTMVEQNVPAQAPTRTDEQIVPRSQWLQIGKSNLLFDAQKIQKNPIFQISVDILRNTNFFRAFSASASVPAIYIQQFWNSMKYDEKTGVYCCQVDEQKGKPAFQLVDEDDVAQQESAPQEEGDDPDLELAKRMSLEAHQEKGKGERDDADIERAIKLSLDPAFLPQGQAPVGGVTIRDPVSETTPKLPEVVGKGKAIVTEEQVAHSLIDLSKKKRTTDQFILVRRDQTPHDSTTGPSSQPEDDTSEKVIHESSSTSDSEQTESETEAAAPKGDKDQGEC
ncbi:hypothetical protein Tco_0064791 [Tanacetum coccineum]